MNLFSELNGLITEFYKFHRLLITELSSGSTYMEFLKGIIERRSVR